MTRNEVYDLFHREFPTHQSFVRWKKPVMWEGLTLVNASTSKDPDYIRVIDISWKGDFVASITFDHDIRKWSEGRRHVAYRVWKELENKNA